MKPSCSKWLSAGVLLFGVLLYFFVNFQRVAIPGTVFGELQTSLGLSAPQITALGALFMYVYAIGQLLAGLCADRFGGVRTILGGGALLAAGSLLFPLVSSPLLLYAARLLTGFGASFLYLAMVKLALAAFPNLRSVAISSILMIGYSGGIVAGAPLAAILAHCDWRAILLGAGTITLSVYIVFALLSAFSAKPPIAGTRLNLTNYFIILKSGHNRRIFLFNALIFGACYVLQTVIGKKFLEDFCAMKPVNAAWVISAMAVAAACGSMLFSALTQLFGNRRKTFYLIAAGCALTSYSVLALLWLGDFRIGAIAGVMMIAATFPASLGGITIPYLAETNPASMAVSAAAFCNFGSYIAVAVFGNLSGVLLKCFPAAVTEQGTAYAPAAYGTLFLILATTTLIALILALNLRETFGKPTVVH